MAIPIIIDIQMRICYCFSLIMQVFKKNLLHLKSKYAKETEQ